MTSDKYQRLGNSVSRVSSDYKETMRAITIRVQPPKKELFSMTLTASTTAEKKGGITMDEQQFLIDLIFKPKEPGLKLRLAETQLLLAYIGEILKEVEEEEKLIVER
jgi:hypothetical protein